MGSTGAGVDLAKQVFQVHGVDRGGSARLGANVERSRWIADLERDVERGCEIGMEAVVARTDWVRVLYSKGYRVKLDRPGVREAVREDEQDRRE